MTGSNCEDQNVTSLLIENKEVIFWPKGLESIFNKLTNIVLTSSKLSSIKQLNLKHYEGLKELNLSYNNIISLDANLFEFNLKLQTVSFRGNKIVVIGENLLLPLKLLDIADFRDNVCTNQEILFTDFGKDKFEKCTLVKMIERSLDLKEKLESIETKFSACDGNLDSSTKLLYISSKLKSAEEETMKLEIELNCQFDFKETCVAVGLNVGSAGLFVNSKLASFKELLGREVTKKLIIVDQRTLFLPENLAQVFVQLTELEVTSSGLFEIVSKVFSNMTHLTTLNITHNKVRELSLNTFQDLVNLLILDLSNNKIEVMSSEAFHNLKKLYHLNLSDNKLKSISNNFQGLFNNLRFLSLKNNRLKFISANLLSSESKFNILDLTSNDCIDMKLPEQSSSEIQSKIIGNCIEPLQLTCNFGHEQLASPTFTGYACKVDSLFIEFPQTKISKLNGEHSKNFGTDSVSGFLAIGQTMKFLPFQLAQMLPNVKNILIDRSQLTALQKNDFEGFKLLKEIFIRFNNLTSIDPEVFNLQGLEILDLSSNNIQSLPSKLFLKLIQLKSLNLSNNSLQKLPAELLLRKNKIQEFWLNNNKLEIIEIQVIRCLRRALIVDLSNNECIDMKYDKQGGSKIFAELFTEVDVSCSPENMNY